MTQESSFGVYRGYSEPGFPDSARSSCYVEMRDGVCLAVDLFRPSANGQVVEEPLPTIWTHTDISGLIDAIG